MKKFALNMILFGAIAGIAQAQHQVKCTGTESGGAGDVDASCSAGTRLYAYPVTADAANPVEKVSIGTEDCSTFRYTNVCMPTGWTFAISTGSFSDDDVKTAHDALTNASPPGACPCIVTFDVGTGTAIAAGASFTFGFDNPFPSHDVGWLAEDLTVTLSTTETFGSPSGDGVGPVHGPKEPGIPAVSEWGIIVMVLLALTAGTVVFARWRRPVAA